MVWRIVVTDVRGRQHAQDVADVEQLRREWAPDAGRPGRTGVDVAAVA